MAFDLKKHVIRVQGGREYLPVSARLVWFRGEHPDWGIVTEAIEINLEKQYAIYKASIFNEDGKLMATATKMENVKGFGDYLEKAETGAVGRALAYCGYGTQFAPELEEGSRLADAPRGGGGMNRFGSSPRPGGGGGYNGGNDGGYNGGGGNGNGGGGNGFANRPGGSAPPPLMNRAPAPAVRDLPPPGHLSQMTAPPSDGPDDDFGDDNAPPPAPRAAQASANRPSAPAPANREVAPPSGGITRVREPERTTLDPGGDDDDDENPFGDEDDLDNVPAPPARAAASRPAAAPRPAPSNEDDNDEAEDTPALAPKPKTVSDNRCTVDGCGIPLSAAQMTMSMNKFGRAICPAHQRDATPVAAGTGGAPRRPAAKPSADANLL